MLIGLTLKSSLDSLNKCFVLPSSYTTFPHTTYVHIILGFHSFSSLLKLLICPPPSDLVGDLAFVSKVKFHRNSTTSWTSLRVSILIYCAFLSIKLDKPSMILLKCSALSPHTLSPTWDMDPLTFSSLLHISHQHYKCCTLSTK